MGTRTKGDYGKFSRVSMNQAEARELRGAFERHEPATKIVDAALGVIGVSVPAVGALVLAGKVGYSLYKGIKEYKNTGSIIEGLKVTGIGVAKNVMTDLLMPKAVTSAVGIIAPATLKYLLPKDKKMAAADMKIIETAASVAGGVI